MVCNIPQPHEHDSTATLILPEKFRYQGDAVFEQKLTGCALDEVCLVDLRHQRDQINTHARIQARVEKEKSGGSTYVHHVFFSLITSLIILLHTGWPPTLDITADC